MKQMTAIEWLKEQYDSCPPYEQFLGEIEWEQAKEMEKEQIIEACMYEFADDYDSAEEYYEETFKSE